MTGEDLGPEADVAVVWPTLDLTILLGRPFVVGMGTQSAVTSGETFTYADLAASHRRAFPLPDTVVRPRVEE